MEEVQGVPCAHTPQTSGGDLELLWCHDDYVLRVSKKREEEEDKKSLLAQELRENAAIGNIVREGRELSRQQMRGIGMGTFASYYLYIVVEAVRQSTTPT